MSIRSQGSQPSMQRFHLLKFSQAAVQVRNEQKPPWTHSTDKDIYWIIDDNHFSRNHVQGKVMQVVQGQKQLVFLPLEDAIKRCNEIISMNSSQGVGLQPSQYPFIAMHQCPRIAFRYNIGYGQVQRLQMLMESEADFEAAMATLRSLGCPLDSKDIPRSRHSETHTSSVGPANQNVQPGPFPNHHPFQQQTATHTGHFQQTEAQAHCRPIENTFGFNQPGGSTDNNRNFQPDPGFGSSKTTSSPVKSPRVHPYTTSDRISRSSTELMPPPREVPLQPSVGNQSHNSRAIGSSSSINNRRVSAGTFEPSHDEPQSMDIDRPSLSRTSMLSLPSGAPQNGYMHQDLENRPLTGITDRSIKSSGSSPRPPLQFEHASRNPGISSRPLNTVNDAGVNATATVPKYRPESSALKPFAPATAFSSEHDQMVSSLAQYSALPESQRLHQLGVSLSRLVHDENFLALCEDYEKAAELRFGVEEAVEQRKERNSGRNSFR